MKGTKPKRNSDLPTLVHVAGLVVDVRFCSALKTAGKSENVTVTVGFLKEWETILFQGESWEVCIMPHGLPLHELRPETTPDAASNNEYLRRQNDQIIQERKTIESLIADGTIRTIPLVPSVASKASRVKLRKAKRRVPV